jgi:RNA polymerase sigma factor (sigma-70 family)
MTYYSGWKSPDSSTLYAGCTSNDPAQQSEAYEQLWAYLYRVALRVVRAQPDPEALAQDCAQRALIRVHNKIETCNGPASFKGWSRRIAFNEGLDVLRKRKRLYDLMDEDDNVRPEAEEKAQHILPEQVVETLTREDMLRRLLLQSPISDRSKRVVIGRIVDDYDDGYLADVESELAGSEVKTSHIQVTRSKNLKKLSDYRPILDFLEE